MTSNLTPEIAKLDKPSDFQAVGLGTKTQNSSVEQGLLGYVQGMYNKMKGLASQARKDRETAGELAQQAQKSTVEAGALAQTTATLTEETRELKKGADISAKNANTSEKGAKDALVNAKQEASVAESAKNETLQSQVKVEKVAEVIEEKMARIDEKEGGVIERTGNLV